MRKKLTFKKTFFSFLNGKLKLKRYEIVCAFLLVIVLSGFVGWIWEFFLDEVRANFAKPYIKGGNFLPWINLYAYGSALIIPATYKIRKSPLKVLLVAILLAGVLELIAGWLVFTFKDGARYWDYTKDWWGIGNINGFVCPVSALVFGLLSLFLVYFLEPFCIFIVTHTKKQKILIISWTLFLIVIFDDALNFTLSSLNLPNAHDFYLSIGWEIKP